MSDGPTDAQKRYIESTVEMLANRLHHKKVPAPVAASALMILAAQAAAQSLETDEYIIDQFRKTLGGMRAVFPLKGQKETKQ